MGTGQPHRYFQQYALADSLNRRRGCNKRLMDVQMLGEKIVQTKTNRGMTGRGPPLQLLLSILTPSDFIHLYECEKGRLSGICQKLTLCIMWNKGADGMSC